jgi:bacteriorhodopsin
MGSQKTHSPSAPKMQKTFMGFHHSSLFCFFSITLFFPTLLLVLKFVPTDPAALLLGGEPIPPHQWALTQMAFATCLLLDFISWLWTVDRDKSRLFYFALVINGLPVVTYGLLASGVTPILIDSHGRRLIVIRYLQWIFTTPTMLYLYSIISSIPNNDVITSMGLAVSVLIFGLVGSIMPFPFDIIFIGLSFFAFYFVLVSLTKMITVAINDSSLEDTTYRGALRGARLFMTLTWVGIPLIWTLAYVGAVSHRVEETLFSMLDFASKAGVSCMILNSSIKTHAEKQDERMQAALQEERARTIDALQEAARMKARPLPPLASAGVPPPSLRSLPSLHTRKFQDPPSLHTNICLLPPRPFPPLSPSTPTYSISDAPPPPAPNRRRISSPPCRTSSVRRSPAS